MSRFDAAIELLTYELKHYKTPYSSERLREIGRGIDTLKAARELRKDDLRTALAPGVTAEKSWSIERLEGLFSALLGNGK